MSKNQRDLKELIEQQVGEIDSEQKPELVENKIERQPSRVGKKVIQGHFDKSVHDQLQLLKIETGKSLQDLLAIGLNALFKMHNKPPIA